MTSTLAQPRLQILLADSDHDSFVQLTLLLDEIAPRRFVLQWAVTYGFAVAAMRRQQFDLCLVSSQIGHRRGSDLVTHIKANAPGLPVIMLGNSEEMADAPATQSLDCLDRNRLSSAMLRQAIRDALFRSASGVLTASVQTKSAASDFIRAAA